MVNSISTSLGLLEEGTQSQTLPWDELHVGRSADMETTCNPPSQKNEDEDFDDMDEDTCAEDLEFMVARYDSGLSVEDAMSSGSVKGAKGFKTGASELVTQTKVSGAESEDEFGDNFSYTDFEAAEAAATQSLQHSANSQVPVRIKFP